MCLTGGEGSKDGGNGRWQNEEERVAANSEWMDSILWLKKRGRGGGRRRLKLLFAVVYEILFRLIN